MNLLKTAMLLAFLTALFMAVGYAAGGGPGMAIAFFMAVATNFYSYWNSGKMVLSMHRAVEAGPENAPEFHEIVRRLSQAAELPMPRVYIFDSPQPNAFATGRNPQNAAIAASRGLLETLPPEEVAGVIAHELAHIASRDTLIMTVTATLAGAISMLGNFAFFFGRGNRNNPLGSLIAILVAPIAAMIVQMAVSRTREYAADRLGAKIVGKPLWLAAALQRIAAAAGKIPNELAERHPASAHMFIVNPLGFNARDSLFSTHPATENRVARLVEMAGEFEQAGNSGDDARPEIAGEASGPAVDVGDDAAPASKPNPWGRKAAPPEGRNGPRRGPWS